MSSFAHRMIAPLDELACELLRLKQYGRLRLVSELLAIFSSGAWERLEEKHQRDFLGRLRTDFHVRAWDDWDLKDNGAFSRIAALIAAESKAME